MGQNVIILLIMLLFIEVSNEIIEEQKLMDVQIENSQGYFYSKQCELTFTIITNAFSKIPNFSTTAYDTFFVTLGQEQDKSNIHFSRFEQPAYIHLNDGRVYKYQNKDNCYLKTNAKFYCLTIAYSPIIDSISKTRHIINDTFSMYKFTLKNIICPDYENYFDRKIKNKVNIGLVDTQTGQNIVYGDYSINWKYPLQFLYVTNMSLINRNIDGQQYTSNMANRIINCQTTQSINFVINNSSFTNSWSKIIIKLNSNQQLSSIIQLVDQQEQGCFIKYSKQKIYSSNLSYSDIPCTLQINNGLITIQNQYMTPSIVNKLPYQIDVYQLYQYPSNSNQYMPMHVSVKLPKFIINTQSRLDIQVQVRGQIIYTQASQINTTLFYKTQTPFFLFYQSIQNYNQYSDQNAEYLQICKYNHQQQQLIDIDKMYSNSLFQILLMVFILFMIIFLKNKISTRISVIETIIYLIVIIISYPLKILFIILTNSNEKIFIFNNFLRVSFITQILFSLTCSFTYICFICRNCNSLGNNQNRLNLAQRGFKSFLKKRQLLIIIPSFILNYKFYCVFLSHLKFRKKIDGKLYRLRNRQLYFKHIYHLCIDVMIVIIEGAAIWGMNQTNQSKTLLVTCKYILVVFNCLLIYLMIVQINQIRELLKIKKIKRQILRIIDGKNLQLVK